MSDGLYLRRRRQRDARKAGQRMRRDMRIAARTTVATELRRTDAIHQGQLRGLSIVIESFFGLGFWGRLRWLLTGHFDHTRALREGPAVDGIKAA